MSHVGMGWRKVQGLAVKMVALPCLWSMNVEPAFENRKMSESSRENLVLVKTRKKKSFTYKGSSVPERV